MHQRDSFVLLHAGVSPAAAVLSSTYGLAPRDRGCSTLIRTATHQVFLGFPLGSGFRRGPLLLAYFSVPVPRVRAVAGPLGWVFLLRGLVVASSFRVVGGMCTRIMQKNICGYSKVWAENIAILSIVWGGWAASLLPGG